MSSPAACPKPAPKAVRFCCLESSPCNFVTWLILAFASLFPRKEAKRFLSRIRPSSFCACPICFSLSLPLKPLFALSAFALCKTALSFPIVGALVFLAVGLFSCIPRKRFVSGTCFALSVVLLAVLLADPAERLFAVPPFFSLISFCAAETITFFPVVPRSPLSSISLRSLSLSVMSQPSLSFLHVIFLSAGGNHFQRAAFQHLVNLA